MPQLPISSPTTAPHAPQLTLTTALTPTNRRLQPSLETLLLHLNPKCCFLQTHSSRHLGKSLSGLRRRYICDHPNV